MKKTFSYTTTQIGDGIYLVDEHYSSMFVIVGEKRALVIDCGTGVGDFRAVVEGITKLPYDVALTHSHVDHAGGRGQFDNLYISKLDAQYVKDVTTSIRKIYTVIAKFSLGANFKCIDIQPVKNEPKLTIIDEGYTFDLGGRTIKAIFTPGHTIGSMSYIDDKTRTIFIGDVANEYLMMYLPHATTIDTMIETHKKLLDIDGYDTVWSSHHTQSQTKQDIETYLQGAMLVSSKHKHNGILPFVYQKYNGARLMYSALRIHNK